jgi:LysR family hydrogen peroxide-inducible transcriptional activator
MTLTQIEYLIAVDTHRHFARAAEACFVSQPTLSMQLKKLEDELGVALFDRGKQPVVPTDAAIRILDEARQMVQLGKRIKEQVRDSSEELHGLLRIGFIPTVAPYIIPLFLGEFQTLYPKVELEIEEVTTANLIAKLKRDELDAGIAATPLPESGLHEQPLFYEPFVAYLSANEALMKKASITIADINLARLWLLAEGHCFRSQVLNLCQKQDANSDTIQVHLKAGSIETLKGLVENNGGMTLLPELATRNFSDEQRDHLRYFKTHEPVREISLITRRQVVKQRLTEALSKTILNVIPQKYISPEKGNIIAI